MRGFRSFKQYLTPLSVVLFMLFVIALAVYLIASRVPAFAELINSTVSVAIRFALGKLFGIFPFSFFELLIILILPLVFLVVFIGIKKGIARVQRIRYVVSLLSVISLIFASYVYTLGIAYLTYPLSDKLGIDGRTEVDATELYNTALIVRDELNKYASVVEYRDGESVMGFSIDELSLKLSHAYDSLLGDYPIFTNYHIRVKPVLFSNVMSDAGITGIYSFFTGEANLNIEYPDCELPFTAAHEVAHAHGVGREDEANFLAFLACVYSDDAYLRYSGYLNLFSYLASALSRSDKELYSDLMADLSECALSDIRASYAVTLEHSDSLLRRINDKANDIYLKGNGTAGTVSYGYVVRLAVAYYNR